MQRTASRRRFGRSFTVIVLCAAVRLLALAADPQAGSQTQVTGPGQSIPATDAPANAAISGVVTDAATKRPLGGVTVSLGMDRAPGILRPPALQQTITDEKGRFVFWPLAPGMGYFVNASALGYFDSGYGREASGTTGRRITLAERQWFERADIEMWKPGAVAGRVLDEHGDAVVGVIVRVMRLVHVAGRAQIASGPNTTTDDRGAYRIGGLAPGRYFVVVPSTQMAAPERVLTPLADTLPPSMSGTLSPPTTGDPMIDVDGANRLVVGRFPVPPSSTDGRLMAYPVTWYPGTPSATTATPVDLEYGADRGNVDIRLQPAVTARVSGIVQGPSIPKLMLRLLAAGSESLGLGAESATALVAPDGSFTFVNVPAGAYTIDARGTITEYEFNAGFARYKLPVPPGLTSSGGSAMSLSSGTPGTGMTTMSFGSDRYWARAPVVVGDRDVTNVVVAVHPAITLEGRLVYEGEAPPSSRFILAEPADGNASLGQPISTNRSSDTTAFLLQGLMPGEYFLRVRASGNWVVKSIVADSRDYADTPFDASSGRDFTDIVVTLTDKSASIEGTVTDAGGHATAAAVIVFPADRARWTNYGVSPTRIKATRVTNVGSYRVNGLPAGEYLVVAVDESQADSWHDPAFFPAASASAGRVSVGWGATAVQPLKVSEVRLR